MEKANRLGVWRAVTAGCGELAISGDCCGRWARANGRCDRHGGGATRYTESGSRGRVVANPCESWPPLLFSLVAAWSETFRG